MPRKFKTNTSSFTIAHYILLFLVTGICIAIIAWIMINRTNNNPSNNITTEHIKYSPCVQRTINTVEQMWAYDPKLIPNKYWKIAMDYLNEPIRTRTYGICQDVAYTCNVGQLRRDCDPCAVPSARQYAREFHIADMIKQNCPDEINKEK